MTALDFSPDNPRAEGAPTDAWAAQTEQGLLDAALALVPDMGWNAPMLARAAGELGLSPAELGLLLPGGPRDLAALLSQRQDADALAVLAALDPRSLRMRERIIRAVEARLETAAATPEATRRWAGYLALPTHAALGLRLAWDTADRLWRWAGDTATDENHYSKRAILAGILVTALPVRLSGGREAAQAYLHARVGQVMRFETWKAKLPKNEMGPKLATLLGRIRYPG